MRTSALIASLLFTAILGGCAKDASSHSVALQNEARWCRLHQTGKTSGTTTASWYGPGYHGKRAANGSIFDQNKLTAAHPSLPFGTQVRVTRMDTGASVVVTITDRFCFNGRALDLSREAARQIDMIGEGTAVVHWSVVLVRA